MGLQEARSAETRALLLDATIECLAELGYARTTTAEIVRRAGVSRGAQVHHFPTKAELVEAALKRLAHRWQQAFREALDRVPPGKSRLEETIDLLWGCYSGPLFSAALEFLVAARTDPQLRKSFEAFEADVRGGIRAACSELAGTRLDDDGPFLEVLELTISVMHGTALNTMFKDAAAGASRIAVWKRLVVPMLENAARAKRD